MMKLDPFIAVQDVSKSALWYEQVFGFTNLHGGDTFAVLTTESGEIILCLHQWGEHEHPTMTNRSITPGNGLILYFRINDIESIYANIQRMSYPIEENLARNPNSGQIEFSVRDPDNYFLIVSAYHEYGG